MSACNGATGEPPGSAGGSAGAASGGSAGADGGTTGGDDSGGSAQGGASNAGRTSDAGAGSAGTAGTGGAGASSGEAGADSAGTSAEAGSGGEGASPRPAVLVFSRTTSFRHTSIPIGIQALTSLSEERDWTLFATEEPTFFSAESLAPYNVILFLSPTGDILDSVEQAAFETFIRAGNGFVGIHAASDTEFDWPFFGELIGAYFDEHPAIQSATIRVENRTHPSTVGLPELWTRTDEWYAFRTNPRANVDVLLSLDEESYDPGTSAMGDHPIAWAHEFEGARVFYTALGHTDESYAETLFLEHIAGAIEWAARVQ